MMNYIQKVQNRIKFWNVPSQFFGLANSRVGQLTHKRIANVAWSQTLRGRQKQVAQLKTPIEIPENDGFVIVPPHLAKTDAFVAGAKKIFEGRDKSVDTVHINNKEYFQHIIEFDKAILDRRTGFIDYCLKVDVINAVSKYIGTVPVLHYLFLGHSPAHSEFRMGGSQMFHIDHEDDRQVKGFLFIDDVTPESGPLTIVKAHATERVCKELGHVKPGRRFKDEEILPKLKAGEFVQLTGPAGTLALVDTSRCFHYGSRTAGKDRLVAVFQYLSPVANIFPWVNGNKIRFHFRNLVTQKDSKLSRLVLSEWI